MKERINILLRILNSQSVSVKAFVIVVLVPTILAVVYYGLIASDIYVSEAKYALRTSSETPTLGVIDSFFGGSPVTSSSNDAYIIRDYILSRQMLQYLDDELKLKSHFQSKDVDYFSRLSHDATNEDFYNFYLKMVQVGLDSSSSVSTLRVKAFTPEYAQKVAKIIISKSEELVNSLNNRIIDDTLHFSRNEVLVAGDDVRKASDALSHFRDKFQSIDPSKETESVLNIVTGLGANLAQARTELIQAESYMKPESIQVKNLKSKVEALKQQIQNERMRLANEKKGDDNLNQLIYDYEPLQLNKTLAEKKYTSALNSLELAKVEAQRKQRYLISFVPPDVPESALEPDRLMNIVSVFLGSLLIYAIGGLMWAAIKDHMRY